MYSLYYSPGAASFVVHWLLLELDAPHELKWLDLDSGEQKRPEYLALNPNGVVPTLVVDGKPHHEAAALLLYLAGDHPRYVSGRLAARLQTVTNNPGSYRETGVAST